MFHRHPRGAEFMRTTQEERRTSKLPQSSPADGRCRNNLHTRRYCKSSTNPVTFPAKLSVFEASISVVCSCRLIVFPWARWFLPHRRHFQDRKVERCLRRVQHWNWRWTALNWCAASWLTVETPLSLVWGRQTAARLQSVWLTFSFSPVPRVILLPTFLINVWWKLHQWYRMLLYFNTFRSMLRSYFENLRSGAIAREL